MTKRMQLVLLRVITAVATIGALFSGSMAGLALAQPRPLNAQAAVSETATATDTPTNTPTNTPTKTATAPQAPGVEIGNPNECRSLNLDQIAAGSRLKQFYGLTFTTSNSSGDMIIYPTGAGWPDADLASFNIGNVFAFVKDLSDANGDGLVDPTEDGPDGNLTITSAFPMSVGTVTFGDIEYAKSVKVEFYGAQGLIQTVEGPRTGNGQAFGINVGLTGVTKIVWYSRNSSVLKLDLTCESAPSTVTPTPTSPEQATTTPTTTNTEQPTATSTPTELPTNTPTNTPVRPPEGQQPQVPTAQQPQPQQPQPQAPVASQAPAAPAAPQVVAPSAPQPSVTPPRRQAVAGVSDETAEQGAPRPQAVLSDTGANDAATWIALAFALILMALGSGIRALQLRRISRK